MGLGRAHPASAAIARAAANWNRVISPDATIGLMAKFKPVRAKARKGPAPQGAIGCVVLILLAMIGVMVFMYFVMRNANG
jgi:hypothetical protein